MSKYLYHLSKIDHFNQFPFNLIKTFRIIFCMCHKTLIFCKNYFRLFVKFKINFYNFCFHIKFFLIKDNRILLSIPINFNLPLFIILQVIL
jgi:hypothetical protein